MGAEERDGGIAVVNPATGETLATVPELGAGEVQALVASARAVQPQWEALGYEGRAEVLLAARNWLVANGERVVTTICAETGRPPDETQFAELAYGVSALEFWAKQASAYLSDEEIESASPFVRGRRLVVRYAPLGVVGVIGPWNYPFNNSFGDCIPALAAGNSVVLKPSEVTPLTSLLMAQMLAECGLPDGVFRVATGRGETGAALVDEVDFVMFTGSVETGKKVMARAARTLTPVSLELGGKDPMIVLADADLERAANAAVSYGLNNSGQVCISVERIYVEDPVHDEFIERLTEKVRALRQGPPGPPGTVDVGAIIFEPQLDLIDAHVKDAVAKGARVLTGGERLPGPGRFYPPTVLADVDHSMRCMVEETFGPTLPVMRVGDADEAVALANDGPYGLQASVWTRDEVRGEQIARRIEAGVACVNDAQVNYGALELPMGGWKSSGLGSRHGADGIRKYTKRQSLMIVPGYAPARDPHHLPYNAQASQLMGESFAALATSELFDDRQRTALATLCDTFIPSLAPPPGDEIHRGFWLRAASHLNAPEGVELALLQAGLPAEQVAGLRGLLDALAGAGMTAEAPQELREQIVHGFCEQSPEALAGIATLRGLCKSIFYALPDLGTGRNANWEAIGFPGPASAPPTGRERPLRIRKPSAPEETIEVDVCIVGSGAGGGVIAGELAQTGRSVAVLEAGGYHDDADFDGLELSAYQRMYLNGGPFPTAEGQVAVVAGTGVGGGTVINWTNCLRTFDHVRAEWATEHGLTDLAEASYDQHLDAVFDRLHVNADCSDLNGPHQRLREGCEKLGYDFRLITRNADPGKYDPESAAYSGFGDPSGSKNSTAKTYLVDAQASGAEILAGCRAQRVLTEGGRAVGVEALWVDPEHATAGDGSATKLTVRAQIVVVACGAIESPALLLRSGIGGPAVGEHLRLHPTVAVTAYYDEPQRWMWGPPQAALSHQFADTGEGYGFLIESAQATTGLFSGAVPWRSGADHKRRMREWAHAAPLIALVRERGGGRVTIDAAGNTVVNYPIADELDRAHLKQGVEQLVRIHEAAGAREIVGSGLRAPDWSRGEDLEGFIAALNGLEIKPREYVTFSAHQMGTCRMGRDPATSVANPWGELHDAPGVWIGDASAFPSASGTNPMATIMALARRTAHAIAAA
ncbi:MAG TPA: aldehyde dehydrogenase family protein [Solirubrobacterales bacterium]|nr:aldehyde dehydrogenase family protein [Solirubrobacterales bacterium]